MKKKFLITILIFICAAACALALPACIFSDNRQGGTGGDDTGIGDTDGDGSDTEHEHEHDYSAFYFNPTCTEDGYILYKCECGDEYQRPYIPATGHSLEQFEGIPATCTKSGCEDYVKCRVCDYTTLKEIKPLGHKLVEHAGENSTCTQHGWAEYEACSRCDYTTIKELPLLDHELAWTTYRSYCAYACVDCGFVSETALHNFVEGECSSCGLERNLYLDTFNGTYGYEYFGTMANREGLQALYSDIDYEVRAFHESGESVSGDCYFAEINYSDYGLSMDEAISVWKTYRDDNPLYYWLSNELVCSVEEIRLYVFDNYADGAARTAQNEKIYAAAEAWTKSIGAQSSAYLKTFAFHDMIIEAVDYAYDDSDNPQSADWAHSILGVFEERGAVCESYAKTFQLLLNVCGVENLLVTGTGGGGDHAWNLVKLDDGEWYWYDLTWDDTPNYFWGLSYNYFSATDEGFLTQHSPYSSNGTGINFLYDLPARSEKEYLPEDNILKEKFTVNSLEFIIIGYNLVSLSDILDEGDIEIPSSVTYGGREYKVAAIGDYDYYDEFGSIRLFRNNVTSVFIPASVNFIADNNFYAWDGLEEINVDENNASYSSLDGVLFTKNRDILMVYPNARRGASYSIPEETTKLGYHAFGTGVLPGRNLESLTIHAGVTRVGIVNWGGGFNNFISGEWNNIVRGLTGKKELIIDENNPAVKVIDGLIMSRVFGYEGYTFVEACMPHTETVIIPDFVTSIERDAFRDIDWVKRVVLPEGWKTIQDHQFTYCHGLESIYIPDSVTSIGNSAFLGCENLKSVIIPEGVTEIADYAFYGCGLTEIIIPDSVQSIGKLAFSYCHNLVSVTLGSGLKEIGISAFKDCEQLESINIPAAGFAMGDGAFAGCRALTVYFHGFEQDWQDILETGAFYDTDVTVIYTNN